MANLLKTGITLILIAILSNCNSVKGNHNKTSIDGYWKTEGYGYIIKIEKNKVKEFYNYTHYAVTPMNVDQYIDVMEITILEDNRIKVVIVPAQIEFIASMYRQIGDFTPPEMNNDPEFNFEVFWHTFKENYAFFNKKGIDWDEIYKKYRSIITSSTTNTELFNILSDITNKFGDAHIQLYSPEGLSWTNPKEKPQYFAKKFNEAMKYSETIDYEPGFIGRLYEEAYLVELLPAIKKRLTDGNDFRRTGNGLILYGRMGTSTGYINILSASGYSHDGNEDELTIINKSMDEIVNYLSGCTKIIVDNRFGDGGHDFLMLEVASRFANEKTLIGTKKAVNDMSYTKSRELYLNPNGKKCFNNNETLLLNSPLTVSASEVLTLSLRALPNTRIIGMDTMGCLSNTLMKMLPNGFTYTLSNEIYKSHDGYIFENSGTLGKGIKPDIPVDINIERFIEEGEDQILSKALDID